MIVWIASYPRSGNTLTRSILYDCFGIKSYTFHGNEQGTDGLFPWQNDFDLNDAKVYEELSNSKDIYFVKTHYAICDGNPVIHVMRNGKNAITSYAKLLKVPAVNAIVGQASNFPTWSSHFWAYEGRSNSLQLKFEEMLLDTDAAVEKIGTFIGIDPQKKFVNKFEPANRILGTGGQQSDEFGDFETLLFQRCHGVVMGVLGYA